MPFNRKLYVHDDIESLAYLILKLCFGELSWERVPGDKFSAEAIDEVL